MEWKTLSYFELVFLIHFTNRKFQSYSIYDRKNVSFIKDSFMICISIKIFLSEKTTSSYPLVSNPQCSPFLKSLQNIKYSFAQPIIVLWILVTSMIFHSHLWLVLQTRPHCWLQGWWSWPNNATWRASEPQAPHPKIEPGLKEWKSVASKREIHVLLLSTK